MLIDRATITVKGGDGGAGCMSFRREKFVPRGGPNGGDGGEGGDVYFKANSRLKTLYDFARKPHYEGLKGGDGSSYLKFGADGDDLVLEVPIGTTVYRDNEAIVDFLEDGQTHLIAKGGRGGRGNVHFKSSTRQAPRLSEKGEPGESFELRLQLRVIADVGLIGMPNAGKSTLLSRLTRARPKIANYPFTTLTPNLGVAVYHDREIVFADIPGLIEGSHTGKGLGHEFLQHVERTRVLVHVVDPLGFEKSAKENIKIINDELKLFSKELARKPQLIVVNKQDLTGAEDVFKEVKRSFKKHKVLLMSGISGSGIQELLDEVVKLLAQIPVQSFVFDRAATPIHVRLEPGFWVEKGEDAYVVKGKRVEKLIAMTNFKYPEALERTQHILKKMGIERALTNKGAMPGDTVHIGDFEFFFEPDTEIPRPPGKRAARR